METVSFWEDEKFLEPDGGAGHAMVGTCSTPLSCALKTVRTVNLRLYLFYHKKVIRVCKRPDPRRPHPGEERPRRPAWHAEVQSGCRLDASVRGFSEDRQPVLTPRGSEPGAKKPTETVVLHMWRTSRKPKHREGTCSQPGPERSASLKLRRPMCRARVPHASIGVHVPWKSLERKFQR